MNEAKVPNKKVLNSKIKKKNIKQTDSIQCSVGLTSGAAGGNDSQESQA